MSGVITAGAVIGGVVGGGSSLININKQNKQKTKNQDNIQYMLM